MSNSLWPHGMYRPWNSPGQNSGVGSLSLLQGFFPTQGSSPGLTHCGWILCEPQGKPKNLANYWKGTLILRSNFQPKPVVPNLLGTRDRFCGRQLFYGPGWGGWAVVSEWVKGITFILHFISSIITSDPPQIIRYQIPEGLSHLETDHKHPLKTLKPDSLDSSFLREIFKKDFE